MIDDDTIRRTLDAHDIGWQADSQAEHWQRVNAFARAVWSLGRDAGLEEAAVTAWTQYMDACRKMHLPPSQWESFLVAPAIRALKENKHER